MSGSRIKFSIAKLAAVCVALAFIALLVTSSAAKPQTEPDRDWTAKTFPAVFDELFSIRQAAGDFIAVRAHRGGENDLPEFSIVLENTQSAHSMTATLRESQGSSIFQQLMALHSAQLSKSAEELKPELKIQTWKFSADQCPAVVTQFKAFNNIQFVRPRDDDPVDEHPILYQFHESVGGGDSEVTEFIESRAFPRWANDTHKALDACAASAPGSGTL
jgi:hypothetical protein